MKLVGSVTVSGLHMGEWWLGERPMFSCTLLNISPGSLVTSWLSRDAGLQEVVVDLGNNRG